MVVCKKIVRAQGGDLVATLPVAKENQVVVAESDGVVTQMDAMAIGVAAWRLGAGRARKEDAVQAGAGVVMHAKPGDRVVKGQPLLTLLTDTPEAFDRAKEALVGGIEIGPQAVAAQPLLIDRIS